MTYEPLDERNAEAVTTPRRGMLRILAGAALGVVVLLGLAGCGGEEDDDEDDD